MKTANGIFCEFAYSNACAVLPKKVMHEISFFLRAFAREIVSSSWFMEIRIAFVGCDGAMSARAVTLSKPKEIPTAGIFLLR